jgi:hypothetical protein
MDYVLRVISQNINLGFPPAFYGLCFKGYFSKHYA